MISFGFVGIGQGGCNITDVFAKKFPTLAINTAKQDLEALKNIPSDRRIFTKVSDGGAGKNIKLGERAVREYKEVIEDKIDMIMREVDLIWVLVGLGGGSGSLGALQLIQQIARQGKKVGLIATLPTEEEGTHEKVNALMAVNQIIELHNISNNFKGVLFIDNDKLKQRVLNLGQFSYEDFWVKANEVIYEDFFSLSEFITKSAIKNIDQEDFKNVLLEKGCFLITESQFEFDGSETVLARQEKRCLLNLARYTKKPS